MGLEKLMLFLAILLVNTVAWNLNVQQNFNRQLPLVINTWEFTAANTAAWKILNESSNSALDALVEGCSTCERLQCDGTVGFGGSPDENGETTLDALIVDGSTMNMGAVAGLKQIKDATRLARYVLEHTEHTMLVGDAASDFAEMLGFPRESLSTPESISVWQKWRKENCQPNFWRNVHPDPRKSCGPYTPLSEKNGKCVRTKYSFGKYNHDTIGMIVINAEGHIYAGTSTNGARHKIPGRVGDSPIPGAGAYADNTVGAAVATGDGDIMMRFLPSFLAVEQLRMGRTPEQAAQYAMERIVRHHSVFTGAVIAVDRYGNYSAACVGMKQFPFSIAGANIGNTRVENKDCLNIAFL